MTEKNFIPNKTALITLIAACLVVIISLGIRQTFGLFFFDFEVDLGCTQTEFGFAMGIQLFFWGLLGPIFGIITDKFGKDISLESDGSLVASSTSALQNEIIRLIN